MKNNIITLQNIIRIYADITIEELQEFLYRNLIFPNVEVFIEKDLGLRKDILEYLCKYFPINEFVIFGKSNQTELYNQKETEVFIKNVNLVRQTYHKNLFFEGKYSVEQGLEAGRQINKWVEIIEKARVNGEPLSVYEKYLCAYQYAINYEYKLAETDVCRDLIGVLTGDSICCVGFANILCELCGRLGITCLPQNVKVYSTDGKVEYHRNCMVRLYDEKYGIEGVYYADPCWDCIDKENKFSTLIFPHMKYKDIENIYGNDIEIEIEEESFKQQLFSDSYSKINEIDTELEKLLVEESLSLLSGKRDFYKYIVEDVVIDFLSEIPKQKGFLKLFPDKSIYSKVKDLCDDMFIDIVIYDTLNKKTESNLIYVLTSFRKKYGLGDEEIISIFKEYSNKFIPTKFHAKVNILNNIELYKKYYMNVKKINSFNAEMGKKFYDCKHKATTIDEKTMISALENIGLAFYKSPIKAKYYANEKFNDSVQHAKNNSNFHRAKTENPVIIKANSLLQSGRERA